MNWAKKNQADKTKSEESLKVNAVMHMALLKMHRTLLIPSSEDKTSLYLVLPDLAG